MCELFSVPESPVSGRLVLQHVVLLARNTCSDQPNVHGSTIPVIEKWASCLELWKLGIHLFKLYITPSAQVHRRHHVHLPVPTDFLMAANEEPHFLLFHIFLPANFEFDVIKSSGCTAGHHLVLYFTGCQSLMRSDSLF
ncbi:hypothetical protein CY34DRAFT_214508 [Suillus luteus UH-Slu-Lm8-n1]|uniref:Unplaced genomic scaffold CY34scaffold_140, whole genome shotgun sequence n=1 Tax=Suillus luteus UH-Slu-Lm8-n1 TaxID=930992 RepID=A0A0D0B4G0_9AGAM|nr:hypothetical protein CY34DRAFT_214508 [Suillus luteus UH-Slu-Lm8-n1]